MPVLAPPTAAASVSVAVGDVIDRSLAAAAAKFTAGLSPAEMAGVFLDWTAHLAVAPSKRLQLVEKAVRKTARLARYGHVLALRGTPAPCIEPLPQDRRFAGEAWQRWPYNLIYRELAEPYKELAEPYKEVPRSIRQPTNPPPQR
jgi:polyhydroxyalkanoate synthase